MTYQQTLDWMFAQLPNYQQKGAVAYKADLGNIILLLDHLGNPHKDFKTVHVGGTNGKGSTSSMITSVMMESGYKVGLYTSPHLIDFRERITVNGQLVSKEFVINFISVNKEFFEANELSFFEMCVGMAFSYFKEQQVDLAVIEVGMGGRLDATNVITPLVSVITNIDRDHTAFLGNTLELIAFEKAGIIKPNIPVVIGEYTQQTKQVFIKRADQLQAPIYFASDIIVEQALQSDLKGDYQQSNIKTACTALSILKKHFSISELHQREGLLHVVANTHLQGRWQVLCERPKVIADTAHNKHGLSITMNQLKAENYENLFIVFGVVNDKDLSEVLPILPKQAKYMFACPNIPRGLNADILRDQASEYGLNGVVCNSVSDAYAMARDLASDSDLIYIGGSTFVVAEIL